MVIRLEKVKNGWTIETTLSAETPTRTVQIAKDREDLMRLLSFLIPKD